MLSHNTPQNFDYFLEPFFYQDCYRHIKNIKITIKNSI